MGMRVVKLDVGHNVRREAPDEFARIVAEVADGCRGASEPK